jgi:hypothetical protein
MRFAARQVAAMTTLLRLTVTERIKRTWRSVLIASEMKEFT